MADLNAKFLETNDIWQIGACKRNRRKNPKQFQNVMIVRERMQTRNFPS